MSKSESTSIQPKSIRQKRILETAAENPGASLAEIAEEIPSASADHVDRVLDRYGDPAASDDSDADDSQPESPTSASMEDESLDSTDDPEDHPEPEQTNQTDDLEPPAEQEPDESSLTDMPDDTPPMDSDTDAEPAGSVAESKPELHNDAEEVTADDTDTVSSADDTTPDPEDLTQKERETLRAIFYEPTATQDQIADMLSISRATVSNRVNAISGFDWADRGSFVDKLFDEQLTVGDSVSPANGGDSVAAQNAGKEVVTDGAPSASADPSVSDSAPRNPHNTTNDGVVDGPAPSDPEPSDQDGTTDSMAAESGDTVEAMSHQLDELAQQLATMEQELDNSSEADEEPPLGDTDLLHKVVHACMNSDQITEDEELEILEGLMN
ncbi:winged helix-turn-helix transcriptional regulator [Halorubrum ejinorense]|uniref:Winged helix-turn-helix transcriptional regulator n=1 Tax=Halorubrum ejinorense TaxID=425309 RepID=A0AAV3SU26_9EURY